VDQSPPIAPPPRAGLALIYDVFVAPLRAYATLAVRAQWWPAALIVIACIVASNLLALPAQLHVEKLHLTNAIIAQDAVLQSVDLLQVVVAWAFIASIFVSFSPGEKRRYRTYFALAVAGSLPAGLGALLSGLAVRLHDPASFQSMAQIVNALPVSLAAFTPQATRGELAFMSSFDLFTVWKLVFVAVGARLIGGIRPVVALIVVFSIDFAFALTQALPLP